MPRRHRHHPVLEPLIQDAGSLRGRDAQRAWIVARADVRDSLQRELMAQYLLDERRSPNELRAFAAVYPNANGFLSANLLTQETPRLGADLLDHDRTALRVVEEWLADPRFEGRRETLLSMRKRLLEFTIRERAAPSASGPGG